MLIQRSVLFFAMNLFSVSSAFQVSFVVSVFRLLDRSRYAEINLSTSRFFLGRLGCGKTFSSTDSFIINRT